jgi:tetratricopeptide (TPR) repeat protein
VLRHCDEALRLSPRDPLLILWYLPKGWAALNAELYEEAIEFAIRAAEANAEFPDVYAVRAAAEGQLGRVDAGRTTLDELLRRMPALTVADERLNRPFARAADRERFLTGPIAVQGTAALGALPPLPGQATFDGICLHSDYNQCDRGRLRAALVVTRPHGSSRLAFARR